MAVYNISYDLHRPEQEYDKLYKAIKSLGDYRRPLLSLWFVATTSTSKTIYESLKPHLDTNDKIYIQKTMSDYWGALPRGEAGKEFWEWLSKNV